MKLIISLFALLPFISFGQDLLPKSDGQIVNHSYYSLSYSEKNEQAKWVYYELTPQMINGSQSRTDDFREDNSITERSASSQDYKGSGYDRGHLAPAADMKLSRTSMSESFYLSNMSPSTGSFFQSRGMENVRTSSAYLVFRRRKTLRSYWPYISKQ